MDIDIRWDASQAEAVLTILERRLRGESDRLADWDCLMNSKPQTVLRKREAQMKTAFSDRGFITFLLDPDLLSYYAEFRQTLAEWSKLNLSACARQALAYLPPGYRIRGSCYPVIKPMNNHFVFEDADEAGVFLALDANVTLPKLQNTVVHELHHIGLHSGAVETNRPFEHADIAPVLHWLWAFGEGFAMLAAACSLDVHPHATSVEADRNRWDREMRSTPENFGRLDGFLCRVLGSNEPGVEDEGNSFFGVQGPWYTVGYHMSALVERRCGRRTLFDCMRDPRLLLLNYQRLIDSDPLQPRWSAELINALAGDRIAGTV